MSLNSGFSRSGVRVVDDGQHGNFSGLDRLGERPSRRPLIVDDIAPLVFQALGVVNG